MIAVGVTVAVISVYLFMEGSNKAQNTSERLKLLKGEISVFQYCSHIGNARIDDEKCQDFNLLYGPP
jgi:hypothetical protein